MAAAVRRIAIGLALASGAFLTLRAAPAHADLDADAERLRTELAKSGSVRRLEPRFVERGGFLPLLLPPEFVDPLSEDCVTVAVLGVPTATFVLRFLPGRGALVWPDGEHPELAVAGAAQLVRCGVRKAMLGRLALEMRSPRGVIEVIVARGDRPFPPLAGVLPTRNPGPLPAPSFTGARARPGPLEARLRTRVLTAKRAGFTVANSRAEDADPGGRGVLRFTLAPGCHRLDVLGSEVDGAELDIDAELFLGASLEPARSNRAEAPDAHFQLCIAERTKASVAFQGAPASSRVSLLTFTRPIDAALPGRWAGAERAAIAEALTHRRGARRVDAPVMTARGVSGVTLVPVELEPGACYVAAVAAVRGRSLGVALSLTLAGRQFQNQIGPDGAGTTLAFCVDGDATPELTIEARGPGLAWLFALFRSGHSPPGEPAE